MDSKVPLVTTDERVDKHHIMARVSDLEGECKVQAPILGFENFPLVTLKESVEPFRDHVPYLASFVETTAQWLEKAKPTLPPCITYEAARAICLLSLEWPNSRDSFYFKLNTLLRDAKRPDLKPYFSFLRLILSGLEVLPVVKDRCALVYFSDNFFCRTFAWRGISGNYSEQYQTGKKVIWWGFSRYCPLLCSLRDFIT